MRLILMYDLHFETEQDTKNYTKFHKWIISKGYIMMQYSVYFKILNVPTKVKYEIESIRKRVPEYGNVRILAITDRQYNDIKMLRGVKRINETINTNERRLKIKDD